MAPLNPTAAVYVNCRGHAARARRGRDKKRRGRPRGPTSLHLTNATPRSARRSSASPARFSASEARQALLGRHRCQRPGAVSPVAKPLSVSAEGGNRTHTPFREPDFELTRAVSGRLAWAERFVL